MTVDLYILIGKLLIPPGVVAGNLDFFSCLKMKLKVQLFATPWTIAHQASLSIEFSRPDYWSGLPGQLVQFSLIAQLCLTLCDPMDCSTPGFPVHYQLPELAQTHVYRVGDAIQPSHPLSSPSPPTFNLSQHQGLCQ